VVVDGMIFEFPAADPRKRTSCISFSGLRLISLMIWLKQGSQDFGLEARILGMERSLACVKRFSPFTLPTLQMTFAMAC